MVSYPNSRMITINREQVKKNTTKHYLCAYTENILEASRVLSGTEYKCYIAIMCNRDGYSLTYSPEHISEITGVSTDSARKAFLALIDKGYIIPVNRKQSKFNFFETRKLAQAKERRYITNPSTGELVLMSYEDLVYHTGFRANEYWQRGIREYEYEE